MYKFGYFPYSTVVDYSAREVLRHVTELLKAPGIIKILCVSH